jgi:imidazolonepropionase-like amidohydrolase
MSRFTLRAAALSGLAAFALTAAAAGQETIAITNVQIHVRGGVVIENGTIVMREGRLTGVGADVPVPSGARVIDGTGKLATPGLIDSYSQTGLGEIGGQAPGTQDAGTSLPELGASFNPIRAVNPENTHIPMIRLRGVTSSVVGPRGGPLFDGSGGVISMDGERVSDMIIRENAAVYTSMGEQGSGSEGGGSRAALRMRLHDALQDVLTSMLDEDADEDDDERREGAINERNIEALKPLLLGEIPLVVSVNRLSDIHMALELQEKFGLRMVINGGAEAWRAADELMAAGVAVIVNPTANLPTFDGLGATMENAGILANAGVKVLFAGGRSLTHMAGLAVANGMTRAAAGDGLSLAAAEVWGIADEVGSLEEGKRADVVIWSGDPFELSTTAEHVFIGGREIPEDSRHERLFDRYRDLSRYRTIGR